MTDTVRSTTKRAPMDSMRKSALVAGVLYLVTFIAIGTLPLYGPVLTDSTYILGSGSVTGVRIGALIEVIVALAGIGTALALYPVVRRQSESFALGFLATRALEGAMIFSGVLSVLSLVTLRQDLGAAAGADSASLATAGASLVATYKAQFTLGQTLMPAINAVLLGTLMFRSGLVPRIIPVMGLIGGPLMISSAVGQILGINGQFSVWSLIALVPIFAWELSLGLWMAIKGFRPAPAIAPESSGAAIAPAFANA